MVNGQSFTYELNIRKEYTYLPLPKDAQISKVVAKEEKEEVKLVIYYATEKPKEIVRNDGQEGIEITIYNIGEPITRYDGEDEKITNMYDDTVKIPNGEELRVVIDRWEKTVCEQQLNN